MTDDAFIHLVDDDEAVRDSLEALLASYGFGVKGYASGPDFLRGYRVRGAGCLVLDVHLPQMSGFELMSECLARAIRLPVVMITGRTDPAIRRRAAAAGVVALLDKPFSDEALLSGIHGALDRSLVLSR